MPESLDLDHYRGHPNSQVAYRGHPDLTKLGLEALTTFKAATFGSAHDQGQSLHIVNRLYNHIHIYFFNNE